MEERTSKEQLEALSLPPAMTTMLLPMNMELNMAKKLSEHALVDADPTIHALGNYEQAHVFSSKSGHCAASLSNYPWDASARVTFNKIFPTNDVNARITVAGLLEQLNVTRDPSGYLWYTTSVLISPTESFYMDIRV